MRRFLAPRWLGLHALLVVSLLVFWRLGLWQWHRAHRDVGSWVNYAYAVQWWLFAGFAVFLYVKLVLDELDPADPADRPDPAEELVPVVQRRAPAPADDEDDELAAYNRYLRELDERTGR